MTNLSADQIAELKKAFEVMDANKDGVVTKDELKSLLKGLGEEVTDEVVDEMIKIADENGDGKIQFEEFCKAAAAGNWEYKQEPMQGSWREMFQTTNWNALFHSMKRS